MDLYMLKEMRWGGGALSKMNNSIMKNVKYSKTMRGVEVGIKCSVVSLPLFCPKLPK